MFFGKPVDFCALSMLLLINPLSDMFSSYPADCLSACLQLWDEHGSLLLPLLVVLPIAVSLVVLALAHWHSGNLADG